MWVYIYQSWTEKELKNAYIGEVYEYSYDFRNKSSIILTNDWWTQQSWNIAFNSDGIYLTSSSQNLILSRNLGASLSSAKKIKITQYSKESSTWSTIVALSTWATISQANTWTWPIMDINGGYQQYDIYWSVTNATTISSGTYTQSLTLDLVNKTAVLSCTWKTDQTITITDTQITNILTNSEYLILYIWSGSWTWTVVWDISLTIEY